jgi:hypothetical protein
VDHSILFLFPHFSDLLPIFEVVLLLLLYIPPRHAVRFLSRLVLVYRWPLPASHRLSKFKRVISWAILNKMQAWLMSLLLVCDIMMVPQKMGTRQCHPSATAGMQKKLCAVIALA